ncbi:MAG: MATE family efflux transporter [Spirochaetales bacterium]|nr:MATE family efflux transporter [Spirochaetales bacterium]
MKRSMRTTPEQILNGRILPTLLKLSVPSIIAFTFHTTFNFVDRLFVSRLGAVELGAVGMAFTVQSILLAIGSGTGIGTSSLIARYIGAGNLERARGAAGHTLLIILVLSTILTAAGPPLARPLFVLLGASEEMMPYILGYIRIILFGSLFQFFAMIGNGIMRGEGNTVTPMQVMIIGTAVNIVLDPVLIFGLGPFPAMGVEGAALATVIGRGASCVFLAFSLFSRRNLVIPKLRGLRLDLSIVRGIFGVGGPTIVAQLSNSLGLSLLFILLRPYGDMAKSAFTLGYTYQQVAILPLLGIAQGTLTMSGQNFGARNLERVRAVIRQAVLFGTGLMVAFALVMIGARGVLVRVFTDVPEVIRIGRTMLLVFAVGFPFLAARIILTSFFQGLGMGMKGLFLNVSYIILFALPLALLLSRALGIEGIWWGLVLGNLGSALVGLAWAFRTARKLESYSAVAGGSRS